MWPPTLAPLTSEGTADSHHVAGEGAAAAIAVHRHQARVLDSRAAQRPEALPRNAEAQALGPAGGHAVADQAASPLEPGHAHAARRLASRPPGRAGQPHGHDALDA